MAFDLAAINRLQAMMMTARYTLPLAVSLLRSSFREFLFMGTGKWPRLTAGARFGKMTLGHLVQKLQAKVVLYNV